MFETDGQDSQVENSQEEVTEDQPIDSSQGSDSEDQGTGGINPAWNPLLESLPAGLHSQITPHLTKWDQNFQNKIQEVHSQYEPYKPFLENQVQPDQINYALSILQAIEESPQDVMNALKAYIGEEDDTEQQGQLEDSGNGPEQPEWLNHPEYKRMEDMVNTMAQLLVQQRESEANSQIDSELDAEFTAAQEKHGDFDEEWVLTKMYNNPDLSVEQAVEAYKEFEQGILAKNRKPGPPVLGAGGSVPNPDYSPGKLDSKDRKGLVAQMLAQAAQQNQ